MSESESEIPDFHFDCKANANVVDTSINNTELKELHTGKSKGEVITSKRKRDVKR